MSDDKTSRVRGKLRLSNSKLNTLLEITNAINNNSSEKELFELLEAILVNDLNIGKFILFTKDEDWKASISFGLSQKEANSVNIHPIVEKYNTIESLNSVQEGGLAKLDVVIPVFHKESPLAYLLLADLEGEKIEISPIIKNLRFIQTLANITVVALENKRLAKEYIKQIEVKKELELAQNIQQLLFPRKLPNSKELSIKAFYLPHSEVGGDYYDVVQLSSGKTALCIADVSGKGMSAALLMANFQANLRALLNVTDTIEELIVKYNSKIIETANYEKFITLFVGIFDPKTETLTYVNAGHQPAILLQDGQSYLLEKGSTVLGMFDQLPFLESECIQLKKASKFICFTDGLAELETSSNEHLEVEGIEKLIREASSLDQINSILKESISDLGEKNGLSDDVTFLTAEFLR